jgi:hypothetical protein
MIRLANAKSFIAGLLHRWELAHLYFLDRHADMRLRQTRMERNRLMAAEHDILREQTHINQRRQELESA